MHAGSSIVCQCHLIRICVCVIGETLTYDEAAPSPFKLRYKVQANGHHIRSFTISIFKKLAESTARGTT